MTASLPLTTASASGGGRGRASRRGGCGRGRASPRGACRRACRRESCRAGPLAGFCIPARCCHDPIHHRPIHRHPRKTHVARICVQSIGAKPQAYKDHTNYRRLKLLETGLSLSEMVLK